MWLARYDRLICFSDMCLLLNVFPGNYMFIESSTPRVQNETAWLVSPLIQSPGTHFQCFQFWYDSAPSVIKDRSNILNLPVWNAQGLFVWSPYVKRSAASMSRFTTHYRPHFVSNLNDNWCTLNSGEHLRANMALLFDRWWTLIMSICFTSAFTVQIIEQEF